MLVGADDGAIDKVEQPIELAVRIRLLLEGVEELLPDIRSLPAIEAAGHGWPGPVPLRQVPPGRPGAEDPQDAVDNRAMVMGRSPNLWFVRWEQGFKPLPLRVGQISSAHSTQYYMELSRVCKHALVARPPAPTPGGCGDAGSAGQELGSHQEAGLQEVCEEETGSVRYPHRRAPFAGSGGDP